jgi:MSHA pilin protein MshD
MSTITDSRTSGFTLIEVIIAIVVLAAAVSGILFSISQNVSKSADPMITQQAITIAQGYLEEAMLKPYSDPNGVAGCEPSRIQYDDVLDYNCINDTSGARDQFGGTLAGLSAYNVVMSVTTVNIGSPAVAARRIDVTVTNDNNPGLNVVLTGYRTSYY